MKIDTNVKFYFDHPIEIEEFSKTIRLSFPNHKSIEWTDWFKWRFFMNPNSNKPYIAYIELDGIVVSCCTGTPYNIFIDEDGPYKFIHTHSGFTHPDYQGTGLFQKTIKALFEQLKGEGFVSEINFCNHNSHAGYRRIKDRVELSVLNFFKTDLTTFRASRLSGCLAQFEIADGDADDYILKLASQMHFKTQRIFFSRDFDFLKWRLLLIPNKSYKYVSLKYNNTDCAILIFKDFDGSADIMEFFYQEEYIEERYQLFAICVNYLLELGEKEVSMWSNLHSQEHVELEKFGFQERNFSTYFGLIELQHFPELVKYNDWHYRFLDSDVF